MHTYIYVHVYMYVYIYIQVHAGPVTCLTYTGTTYVHRIFIHVSDSQFS
jgi:hypothetical protein